MTKRIRFKAILFATLVALSMSGFAQYQSRGDKYNATDAAFFYKTGNFHDALPLFEILAEQKPNNQECQLKIGICHLNLNQTPEKAIEYIKRVADNNTKTTNVHYYLGRAYALNYRFKKAIETYNVAKDLNTTEYYYKQQIPHLIEQCNNGIQLVKDSLNVEIINLGTPVNSSGNEYSPSINVAENELIFTYRGEKSLGGRLSNTNKPKENGNFNEDIYSTKLSNNIWSVPESISDSINIIME